MKNAGRKLYWGFILLIIILLIVVFIFHMKESIIENFDEEDIDSIKIDLVYTWVDGKDPKWIKKKSEHLGEDPAKLSQSTGPRYYNMDELKYSLRSVHKYAPWINNIYIVVDDVQAPEFLNFDHPKIKIVKHSDIIDPKYLPLFNSMPIEACIHHIPGLSENFLYSNDDCFFGNNVSKDEIYNKCYWHHPDDKFYTPAEIKSNDPQWICTVKNGYWLIKETYPEAELIIPAHVAHFCKKSLMYEIENKYPEAYEITMNQKTRANDKTNLCGSVCLPKMQCILGASKGIYKIMPTTVDFYGYYEMLDNRDVNRLSKIISDKPKLFCINNASEYSEEMEKIMETFYPDPSPYEI